ARQCLTSLVPVSLVRIYASYNHVVPQHDVSCHISDVQLANDATTANTSEADDSARSNGADGVLDYLSNAGAFENDVWLKPQVCNRAGVIGCSECADQFGLRAGIRNIDYVDVKTALFTDQRGQEADWARACYQHRSRFPEGPVADSDDLFPRLCHDCR